MITCNHCGYKSPEGAFNCPKCGAPLSRMEGGFHPRTGGQEQAEIPAWLESLRVGERSASQTSPSTNFSAADLIEEGTLPSWMRPERASNADRTSVSDAFNALHPSAGLSPTTEEGSLPPRGLNLQSLIDEQSLPSWMQEGKESKSAVPQSGFEASSLVDPEALPDWMRSPQASSTVSPLSAQPSIGTPNVSSGSADWMQTLQAQPPTGPVAPLAPPPNLQSIPPAQPSMWGASPEWMKTLQSQQSATASSAAEPAGPPSAGFSTSAFAEPAGPPSAGFSARDLLDEQSLPPWMTQQQSGQSAAIQGGRPGQPGSLSPSSLIDQDALPSWMQESVRPPQQSYNSPAQSPASSPFSVQPLQQSYNPSAQPPASGPFAIQPPQPSYPQNAPPAQGSGLTASSFVDMNALPPWLRSGEETGGPSQQDAGNYAVPGVPSGPPRVENMRVPSRPRGEVNPNESSEAAANAFASVLGVASAAPQFPSAPPPSPYGQSVSAPVQQPPQTPHGMPPMSMPGQQPGQIPVPGIPGMPTQAPGYGGTGVSQQGYGSGVYGQNYAGNTPMGAMPPQTPYRGGVPPTPNPAQQGEEQKTQKKRGLVETLLGWLDRKSVV